MSRESRSVPGADRAIGSQIGKFRLLALAGEGGMGAVWKAEDQSLGRVVALKFLSESMAGTPDARRRFLREARAASRLSHPGIAAVFETGEIESRPFIAIEWIEGETVSALVSRGPLPVADALRIVRDAAAALAHAHAHGVLHRDLSGRNLMVRRDGRVAIVDFGLALPEGTSRITSRNSTVGTIPYMAPEVILGGPSTPQSDVYGLGVVLYQALTGSLPFHGERPESVLYAAVNEPLEPAGKRRPGIPAKVDRIVAVALARSPAGRFGSAQAFAAALAGVESGPARRLPPRAMRAPRRAAGGASRASTIRRSTATRARTTPAEKSPLRSTGVPAWLEGAPPRYLVVLPFLALGTSEAGGSTAGLFALGVTETVRAQLSRYPGLMVVPPGPLGSEAAGGELRDIARSCGADLVLRGSIQQTAGRLRISFTLIDPIQGLQIAGDVLDGTVTEVFSLQDLLARRIAEVLTPGAGSVTALPLRAGLEAVAAQEHYLQALGYLQRFDNEAQVDAAIGLLGELQVGGSDNALVEAALGRAYLFKYQITHDRIWEERAEAACRNALSMDPRSAEVHVTLGTAQRVSGRLSDSVRSFHRALRLRPDHPEALTGLARSLEGRNKLVEAEQVYLRALALRPNFWEPYHLLGGFYFNQGRYQQSATLWERVVELTPDNARAHFNLGGAYFRLERFEDAITALNRAIAIRPEPSAYSNLGTLHYFLGHRSEAAAMFEKAVALRPKLPRLWGNLGDAYRWMPGREAEAIAAFDRAIELMRGELEINPRNADSLGWLAEWLARRGARRTATSTVRRALKLAPRDVNVMARAVNVFHLAGNRTETLKWLRTALRSGYGLAEFERDPDLDALRSDQAYSRLVTSFTAARTGRPTGSHTEGGPGRSIKRGASS
jgi:serine/threonine-protein kinase